MTTANLTAQLLAVATMLIVTVSARPASSQTMDEAVAAYWRGDHATALAGFRPYAEQGNGTAQLYLGNMYADGEGVPEDDTEAVRWYRLAAEQGDAGGQHNLGLMYADGEGVPEDDTEAIRWFRLAAEQGLSYAQHKLGLMYADGEGVPEDAVSAYAWFSIAAAQGHARAKKNKELITKLMTYAQIAKAQKLSREFWTRYVVPFQ